MGTDLSNCLQTWKYGYPQHNLGDSWARTPQKTINIVSGLRKEQRKDGKWFSFFCIVGMGDSANRRKEQHNATGMDSNFNGRFFPLRNPFHLALWRAETHSTVFREPLPLHLIDCLAIELRGKNHFGFLERFFECYQHYLI